MALIDKLERQVLARDAKHKPVRCTYSIVEDPDGGRVLQLDTYGSNERQIKDKKSQSIRFTRQGLAALVALIQNERLTD